MTGFAEMLARPLPQGPSIELIVFGRNKLTELRACLKTVRSLGETPGPFRQAPQTLAIADAGSDDRAIARLRDLAEQEPLRLYECGSELGLSGAINTALTARTRADLTVLLSADATVPPGFFDRLTAPFRDNIDVGIVGPLSNFARWQSVPRPKAPTGKWHHNKLPHGMKLPKFQQHLDEIWARDPILPRVPALSGFCLALREPVLEAVGKADEGLDWLQGGDTDYCFRAADHGFGVKLASNLMVYRSNPGKRDPVFDTQQARHAETVISERFGAERFGRFDAIMANHPALKRLRERTLRLAEAVARGADDSAGSS